MAASSNSNIRIHAKPRISANELAKYMVAGEVGRIGIIKRAKNMSTAVALRYAEARLALSTSLSDAVKGNKITFAAREAFDQRANDNSASVWTREDCRKSVEVIDAFHKMKNQLSGYDFVLPPSDQAYLTLGGTTISVNCDVLTHRPLKSDVEEIGGAIFRLTKPEEDETESSKAKRAIVGKYASTLIFLQVSKNLKGKRIPSTELCWSIDVQCGEIHHAPKNNKVLVNNLTAACSFIAAMWEHV